MTALDSDQVCSDCDSPHHARCRPMRRREVVDLRPWYRTRLVHVWPGNDAIGHELWPGCPCEPVQEAVLDGPDKGLMFIHHAIDGRRN